MNQVTEAINFIIITLYNAYQYIDVYWYIIENIMFVSNSLICDNTTEYQLMSLFHNTSTVGLLHRGGGGTMIIWQRQQQNNVN